MIKKTIYIIILIIVIISLAGIYKFNYLANKSGYDIDGNKIVWNNYVNDIYKYSISYPQNWVINNSWSNDAISKTDSDKYLGGDTTIYKNDSFVFYIFEKIDKNQSIKDVVDISKIDADRIEKEEVNINGIDGVKYIVYGIKGIGGETKSNNVSIYLKKGDLLASFSYGFDESNKDDVLIMDKIINSFKWNY